MVGESRSFLPTFSANDLTILLNSLFFKGILHRVPVAQLDRASASGAEGYRFEPCRGYWTYVDCDPLWHRNVAQKRRGCVE